jgi:purine nucleosidase
MGAEKMIQIAGSGTPSDSPRLVSCRSQLDTHFQTVFGLSRSKQRIEPRTARHKIAPPSPRFLLSAALVFVACLGFLARMSSAQAPAPPAAPTSAQPEKIIIDTDIGDDIDDAFAIALALRSPEVKILGITTTFGDTQLRAKLVDRLLGEAGREDIPVAVGTPTPKKTTFTQRGYAEAGRFARQSHPAAVDFIFNQINQNPGQITLVAIGPLVNVGQLIDKDPAAFRKLKRVVMMGGSVERGYGDPYAAPTPPSPEWNIINDIPAAQKLFASGVPIDMMPLDSTQLKMDEVKRDFLFRQATPLTEALGALYYEWGQPTPTLFDPMTITFILRPEICPVQPMHIDVDAKGYTRPGQGSPNAQVCLHSDSEAFFRFYLSRFASQAAEGSSWMKTPPPQDFLFPWPAPGDKFSMSGHAPA